MAVLKFLNWNNPLRLCWTLYIWAVTWQNQQNECAPSEDSDKPGHPPNLIRVFAVGMKKAWVLSYPFSGQQRLWSDWADAFSSINVFSLFLHVPECFKWLFSGKTAKHSCISFPALLLIAIIQQNMEESVNEGVGASIPGMMVISWTVRDWWLLSVQILKNCCNYS